MRPQDFLSSEYLNSYKDETQIKKLPFAITEDNHNFYRKKLDINYTRTCDCKPTHINCLTPKEWLKSQLGVWQFNYEKRDIRNKNLHPATFPISLAKKVVELFSHEGELIIDPFNGSGTTLIAAQDLNRNALGFDLKHEYVELAESCLNQNWDLIHLTQKSTQIVIEDDARCIGEYVEPETVALIWTSPPYANLLN